MANSTGKSTGLWSSVQPQPRKFDQFEHELQDRCATPIFVPLDFLKAITRDFSEQRELRRDGFGVVYKGVLKNGMALAVKKLESLQPQFQAEVEFLAEVRHPNLHGLRAYHLGQEEAFLVFDYMPKGSLSAALFHARTGNTPVDWATRIATAKDIARGLAYLHDDMGIVHGNLTARNVLFDEQSHQAKMADFGLFRITTAATNFNVLAVARDLGNCAPELFSLMTASAKTDVYSLGIIILQLLTGKLLGGMGMLPQWVVFKMSWGLMREVFDLELMWDENAGPSMNNALVATLMVAMQCVDPSPSGRPHAREVLVKLENAARNGPLLSPQHLQYRDGLELARTRVVPEDVNVDDQSSPEWCQRPADLFQNSNSLDRSSSGYIPFHQLEEITHGFSKERELGTGAFGKVYMGVKDGKKIAIKILVDDIRGLEEDQFVNEFNNLARLQHPNIVRLLGYCHEIRKEFVQYNGRMIVADRIHRALCFEYMPYGSLDKYISDEHHGLDWNTRYNIIKGICMGLKYLHEESKYPVYHLDLKPANILLDKNMMPKIADFGLSRLFEEEQTQITKSSLGTLGYLPLEYIERSIISSKVDIFSLGVVIIKIISGATGYSRSAEMSPQEFVELVHENWRKRLQGEPMQLFESSYSKQVKRCMEIALRSVEADRHKRPSIGDINKELDETDYGSEIIAVSSHVKERPRVVMDGSGHI